MLKGLTLVSNLISGLCLTLLNLGADGFYLTGGGDGLKKFNIFYQPVPPEPPFDCQQPQCRGYL